MIQAFKNSPYARDWCHKHAAGPVSVLLARSQRRMTYLQAFVWTPATQLLQWTPFRQNRLEYACGCSYPTMESSHYYDHNCARCHKALTGGKRW